jgi:PAS domain S-box-containing protein
LVTTVQGFCLASLTLLALIFIALQISDNRRSFRQRTQQMRTDFVAQQKELIKNEMERVLRTIDYQRSRIEQQARRKIRQRIYEAHAIAQNIYEQNREKSSAEIQQMIVDALRPLHFNEGTGYYFIHRRSDAINILNADNPEIEGQSRWDIQDSSGKYLVRDFIALTDRNNETFYPYLWTKPGVEGDEHLKVAFIKKFEPYDWIIGTGLYIEDVESQIQDELLEQIAAIRYSKNGYFFVSDWQGISLAHGAQPELVGRNLWDATDSKGTKTSQRLIALAQQDLGGYVEFWWRKPDTGEERPKITYTRGIKDWQWMIGTGLYTDDIDSEIAELEDQLNLDLYWELAKTVPLSAAILLLFLIVFRILNRRLLNDFSHFSSFFEQAANTDREIDLGQLRFAELYQMAKSANHMLREKISVQQSLQDEKDRYQALHEASFGGISLHDQGEILDCNRSLAEMTGYSTAELIGMDGLKLIAPESLERVRHNIKIDYPDSYEATGIRKDGSYYPMAIRGKNIIYRERRVRVTEFHDISARKQAEAALLESESNLRNILLNLPIAIALTDDQGLLFKNKRFNQLFGYSAEDIKTVEDWWLKAYPDEEIRQRVFETWEAAIHKARAGNTYFDTIEAPISCKDGTERSIEISGILLGKMLVVAFIDVTERKRIEEEHQNIERLKTVGTLAGGLAHDFNNILAALYGNISLAKRKLAAAHPSFRYIESAEKSLGTATQLTNQLLTFAKGGDPLKTSLSLPELIKEVVNFNLSGSNVKPLLSQPDNLWLANVDQGQMQQVFGNLTINAKQAMPNGGHLSISMENIELSDKNEPGLEGGRYLRIEIADEGCGIEKGYLDRIFEPYFTTKQAGSGLGLATSYSIIKRHGGHISVTSELGQGTTFTLYLPAAAEQEGAKVNAEATPSHRQQSARILVMDDEEAIREMLANMLTELNYSAETCSEGTQALKLYRQAAEQNKPFDLVILDLTIPGGIGGKETAQNILALDPEARIVISSGYTEDQLMADHAHYGLAGIVAKPYSLHTLESLLARVLEDKER